MLCGRQQRLGSTASASHPDPPSMSSWNNYFMAFSLFFLTWNAAANSASEIPSLVLSVSLSISAIRPSGDDVLMTVVTVGARAWGGREGGRVHGGGST